MREVRKYINACLHSAKPNHRFNNCTSASEEDNDKIRDLLRNKQFDFKVLKERAKKIIADRQKRSVAIDSSRLNSKSPSQ